MVTTINKGIGWQFERKQDNVEMLIMLVEITVSLKGELFASGKDISNA